MTAQLMETDADGMQSRVQPIPFKIFLASPGDVWDERELARNFIEQIRHDRIFRGHVDLECIA